MRAASWTELGRGADTAPLRYAGAAFGVTALRGGRARGRPRMAMARVARVTTLGKDWKSPHERAGRRWRPACASASPMRTCVAASHSARTPTPASRAEEARGSARPMPDGYARRTPEETVFHRVVRRAWPRLRDRCGRRRGPVRAELGARLKNAANGRLRRGTRGVAGCVDDATGRFSNLEPRVLEGALAEFVVWMSYAPCRAMKPRRQ